jgi:hypothetical protein
MLGLVKKAAATLALPLMFLLGCSEQPKRPANVPSSAVWVDGAFIECTVKAESRANWCTVYRERTGEIIAEGLYVLNTSLSEADQSDLHYAAFGNRIIYLVDSRKLMPWLASERDPINRTMNEKLRALASEGSGEVIDCQKFAAGGGFDERSQCVTRSFTDHKPFFVRYYRKRFISILRGSDSTQFHGIAGDANGNVFVVDYDSSGWVRKYLPNDAQLFDDNRIVVRPCPKPIRFKKFIDEFTCADPISGPPQA